MKNLILILSILFLVSCKGYEPIFSSKNFNFSIVEIINVNDDRITKRIKKKLKKYISYKEKKLYTLEINTKKDELILSKDSKGDPKVFEIKITTNIDVIQNNKKIKNFTLVESFSYNNQSNKFEMSQYKKNVELNLLNKIVENIILNLQSQ